MCVCLEGRGGRPEVWSEWRRVQPLAATELPLQVGLAPVAPAEAAPAAAAAPPAASTPPPLPEWAKPKPRQKPKAPTVPASKPAPAAAPKPAPATAAPAKSRLSELEAVVQSNRQALAEMRDLVASMERAYNARVY